MVQTPKKRLRQALVALLWLYGVVDLLACVAVLMPFPWMETIHRLLGMGELPAAPIVGYLSRSLSLLYALTGAFLLFLAQDVDRYGPLVFFMGVLTAVRGAALLLIDRVVGMPWFWTLGEGPTQIGLGTLVCILERAAHAETTS